MRYQLQLTTTTYNLPSLASAALVTLGTFVVAVQRLTFTSAVSNLDRHLTMAIAVRGAIHLLLGVTIPLRSPYTWEAWDTLVFINLVLATTARKWINVDKFYTAPTRSHSIVNCRISVQRSGCFVCHPTFYLSALFLARGVDQTMRMNRGRFQICISAIAD